MHPAIVKFNRFFGIEPEAPVEKAEEDAWTFVSRHRLSAAILLVVTSIAFVHFLAHPPAY